VNSREKGKGAKIIVTSTVKGEGKTFAAVNLGITLANTGKKTLLVGADLRNPKMYQYMEDETKLQGVTDYLVDDGLCLDKLIGKSKLHTQLDILSSGSIPPNPYELLKQEKIGAMFTKLEGSYDYIIIDTAPSMLVADTFLITQYADLILYVVRAGFTEKELLEFPLNALEEGKLQNLSFVLNDVIVGNLGYGNKYGYGYAQDKPSFWNRPSLLSNNNYKQVKELI
jgi:capsular exopolysaccharide synthesis family protein